MLGSWGYVFKYEVGELCFYQLNNGEKLSPPTVMATMTFDDWGVMKTALKLATSQSNPDKENVGENVIEEKHDKKMQTGEESPEEKRPRSDNYPSNKELSRMKIIFGATWLSGTTTSGRWR
ncbi:Hypothetical protein SMAX5B_002523 [Scophthalmus maximus]|uniref:Uncharacterized protein n=1 Tax=Scophthalmus maximus TaxID=52904 RepID=A0A2U9AWV2_SCOMX|nr:Hypothetical protein SMAX5B_002523 [Scophthalmus maximus]KAF0039227.1 hypothetical protein F2P81_007462 [Scophthalmus maximus]